MFGFLWLFDSFSVSSSDVYDIVESGELFYIH